MALQELRQGLWPLGVSSRQVTTKPFLTLVGGLAGRGR
jgi:hypothetical protein